MNAALKLAATFAQKERVSELRDMWQLYKVSIQIYNDPTISQDQKQQNLISSPKFISLLNNLANDPIHANTVMWIKNHFSVKG